MNFFKFFKKFTKLNFSFNRIEQSQVIIFAPGKYDQCLIDGLNDFKFTRLPLINVEINIFILIKCFFNLEFNKYHYYSRFITSSGSKVVITFIDNSLEFYLLENYFKESQVVFIAVQNGWRSIENDLIILRFAETHYGLCNKGFYMAFSKDIGEILFPKRKIIGIGSIKNNLVEIKGTRDIDVVYISQYQANISEKLLNGVNNNENNFFSSEYFTLKFLISWCKTCNVHLSILLRFQTPEEEISFYQSFLPINDLNFIFREGVLNNYSVIDRAKLVVTIDSTLGYEALSRGCRTIFFSTRSFFEPKYSDLTFGFPLELPKDGPFWTSDFDEVKMLNILSEVNALSECEWKFLISEYKDLFILYSKNNQKYKEKLREILMD